MKAFIIAAIGFVLFVGAVKLFAKEPAQKKGAPTHAAATLGGTEDQKALYALGVAVSQSIASFNLSQEELAQVQLGFSDGALGKTPQVDVQTYIPKLRELQSTRVAAVGKAALDKAAAEPGAKRTESGLIYTTKSEGSGAQPKATDTVKVHYHGTLPNGKVFDSSVDRGEPFTFPLGGGRVIRGWDDGVAGMRVGGKRRLLIPSHFGYGSDGAGGVIPPNASLVFEVELLDVKPH